eukprot:CCRYP_015185-RC/>CCRYP_015185-RC protein AED:0.46 eAED:0.90 QI:0/0/0/1/0/0/3/0/138
MVDKGKSKPCGSRREMEERSSLPDTKLQLSCVVMGDREEWSNDAMGDRERQRRRLVKIHTTTGYNNHNSYPCQPQQQQQPRMEGSACNMQSNSTYQKFESIIKKSTTTARKPCRKGIITQPHRSLQEEFFVVCTPNKG